MVNFPTRIPDCDSHNPALPDLFLTSDASIYSTVAFSLLQNSDHVVVSVSTDFPSNSQRDAPFHRIAYDYSRADWDGLWDHLRDVSWEDIFKLSASQKLGSRDFWQIANSVLNKGKSAIPPLFNSPEVLPSASDKAKLFPENFSMNSSLDDSGISLPVLPF